MKEYYKLVIRLLKNDLFDIILLNYINNILFDLVHFFYVLIIILLDVIH